jgi:hypothetical protein
VVAAEPPTLRVDLDALTVDLDPALEVTVLVEPARVLTDQPRLRWKAGVCS